MNMNRLRFIGNMEAKNNTMRTKVGFSAIDPYIERNMIAPTETQLHGRDWVQWGDGNGYPDYLLELYNSVPTLRSIVNGNVDYIGGNGARLAKLIGDNAEGIVNKHGDTIDAQIRDIARDFEIYGGYALQIIRNTLGEVAEIYYIDVRFLRCDKENSVFYYSEKWGKGTQEAIVYPAFMPSIDWARLTDEERDRHASSILYVKNQHTQVYPSPLYTASVKACEIERCIDDYHLNAINNGFVSSMIVNFNNGVPTDEMKEEIEDAFNEKFSGHQNAGRIMFSWNRSKESATEVITPNIEDFGDRYKALSEHSRQQIFTAFRANPNLFGIPTEGNGFANEQYAESFKLYNRTQIRPVQDNIIRTYDRILGGSGNVAIVPFNMEG